MIREIRFCLLILCFQSIFVNAQTISNLNAVQVGQQLHIHYSLISGSACEVQLKVSTDNGKTWSTSLTKVTGDVGKNIAGGEKQIIWNVLEEREQLMGDKIKFKVIANGKKSFEPEMVFVEGGTFQMGSSLGQSDERPVHSVTLRSFNIGKYEVTQTQWRAVMRNNPSDFSGCENCPVERVSWHEAQDYIRKLNQKTGKKYRLPTEAEWEYAAKGGMVSKGYQYSGSNDINSVAWYTGNSGMKTHVVGDKQANELGIHDMTGNVWEWCSDWYGEYNDYSATNPEGPSIGQNRVFRGGGWGYLADACRAGIRFDGNPEFKDHNRGLRLVLPNN